MKLIRHGITRDVLIVGDWAIKFPKLGRWRHFLDGLIANMDERTVWDGSIVSIKDTGLENPLCPVLWSSWGGWVLVMRRADPYPCPEVSSTHKVAGITDNHHLNYGLLKGRPVCIDYA